MMGSIARFGAGAACLILLAMPTASAAPRERHACAGLKDIDLAQVEIAVAEAISGDKFFAPDGSRQFAPVFCRVQGISRPTPSSAITFELWMPMAGWNGRYYQLGNGGFAGNLHYPSLAAEVRAGNAVAVTDTGHRAGGFNARWAHGQPQKVIDYGYRSLKVTAGASRALIEAFYGKPAHHRYFAGCSNGGRQALVAAQRNPEDWDGIIAGAPAVRWTSQLAGFAAVQHRLRSDPANWLTPAHLSTIQRGALAACTREAGLSGDIAADPRHCRFDPARLICRGATRVGCLTDAQAATVALIQDGPRDPRTGARRYFGFEPTSAAQPGGWDRWIVNPDRSADSQLTFATQAFRHLVLDRATWTVADFVTLDAERARTRRIDGRPLAAVLDPDPDLTAFARRGGKLIMYFGWADPVLSPRAAVDYRERLVRRLGGAERAQAFHRLFMVPGMLHCQGGSTPHAFGQSASAPAWRPGRLHDIRRALESWVEEGTAPDRLVAVKYANDDPGQGVVATRVLAPFPLQPSFPKAAGY